MSLVCDLKVKTEAELESVKWYKDSVEVVGVNLVDTAEYDDVNTLQKTTYEDAVPDKTEGGVYKCEYNFVVGEAISLEFTVAVHCKYYFYFFITVSCFQLNIDLRTSQKFCGG